MGPTLVETMVQAGGEKAQARKLHPFFVRESDASLDAALPTTDTAAPPTANDAAFGRDSDPANTEEKGPQINSSTPRDDVVPTAQNPKRESVKSQSIDGFLTSHLIRPELPGRPDQPSEIVPTPPLSDISGKVNDQDPLSLIGSNNHVAPATNAETPKTMPKSTKVLKFNPKTGTLGSPPKPPKQTPPRPSSRIVTIKYGRTDEERIALGSKIREILDRPPEKPKAAKRGRPRKQPKEAQDGKASREDAKEAHPLFNGKRKPPSANTTKPAEERKRSPPRRQTISMVSPVSPRKQREPFGRKVTNFGSSKPASTRVPGAMNPAWPSQGMAHVRGDEARPSPPHMLPGPEQPRKSKGQIISVASEDSVLGCIRRTIDLSSIWDSLSNDDYLPSPPPKELRLPNRQSESGRKLQHRIRPQLRTLEHFETPAQYDMDLDELAGNTPRKIHPAIAHLFRSLESSLSAFDRSTCESCAWTQKYAPATASQVLQAGKEAFHLRQWLETLKVQSVETGIAEGGGGKTKDKADKPSKKRRKNKLDGFIVDSDTEQDELDEVSDDEPDWSPNDPSPYPRTAIRAGGRKGANRLPNAVIMSGPHGCGKTATVYAVAKELGFEVFEINSSSRRSGKDLLERVGDMTRNHLVQQHQAESSAAEGSGEDEVARDVKSGKQGMMTAFFKPKPGNPPKAMTTTKEKVSKEDSKQAPRAQKQSLILLEEVDVLYEEDKQFWTTLMGMIMQSKRPFVMTCNDESLVPIQSLTLYGILRFSPPSEELATDACLLIAANEGHALQREAVEALYTSRGNDLRATITELNYWCQIGVGDRRGGFDWFYLRWPKGSDLDEHGDVVRVISENTYMRGMGWLARDVVNAPGCRYTPGGEVETLGQCWNHWQRSVGDWHTSLDMRSCVDDMSRATHTPTNLHNLAAYHDLCEALSAADVCSGGVFGSPFQDMLDPSIPALTQKAKEDFVSGRQLLEADPLVPQVSVAHDITTSMSSLARQQLLNHAVHHGNLESSRKLTPVDETKAVDILESSFRSRWPTQLERRDLSLAFDPIAASDSTTPSSTLDPSVFDRTLKLIVLDVAPWVRSIVSSDQHLMLDRKKLSNLLSEGGQRKRMRNTRSAYSALEGGERKSTRREKYFQGDVNPVLVLRTGSEAWQEVTRKMLEDMEKEASDKGQDTPHEEATPPSVEPMDWVGFN